VSLVTKEQQEKRERQGNKERQGNRAPPGGQALQVTKGRKDPQAIKASLDLAEYRERQVSQGSQDLLVKRVPQVRPVRPALKVSREAQGFKASQGCLDRRACKGTPVPKVSKATPVFKD